MVRHVSLSFRVRVVGLVLVVLLPALGLVVYTGLEQRRGAAAAAQHRALALARVVANQQEDLFDRAGHLLTALAQIPVVRRADAAACNDVFARLLKQYRGYVSFGLIAPDGRVVCSAPPEPEGVNLADRLWFREAIARRRFAVGEYVVGRISRKPSVGAGYPVTGDDGVVRGVVFAGLDLEWLGRVAAEVGLPLDTTVTVVDRQGTIIVRHPDPGAWLGTPLSDAALLRAPTSTPTGTAVGSGPDGRRRLYGFARLGENAAAHVLISIPTEVAFAEADRALRRNLLALGLLTLVGLVAWVGFDRFLARRVNAVVTVINRLAAGDLTARLGPTPTGPLVQLVGRTLDHMSEALEARTARLQALSRLNRLVSSSLDLDEVLATIARAASDLMTAPVVAFWVVDETARTLSVRAFSAPAIGSDFDPRPLAFGEGAVGWVALHRRPLDVPDVHGPDSPIGHRDWFRRHGLSSFYGVPVVFGSTLVAVLALTGRAPFRFGPDEHELLESFVGQAAVAIHNAQLYRTSEMRRRTAEVLADLSRLIAQTLDLKAVAAHVTDGLRLLLGSPLATFYEVEPGSGDLVLRALSRRSELVFDWAERLPRGAGSCGLAVQTKETVVTADVLIDPRITVPAELRPLLEASQFRALVALPCCVRDTVIGVIAAGDVTGRTYDEAGIRLARTFADQGAVALENARLLAEAVASEERYRLFFERNLVGLFRTRPDGTFIECNPAFVQILGFVSREEALACDIDELHADPAERRGLFAALRPGQPRVNRELRLHRRDGATISVLMSVAAFEDEGGTYHEGQIVDITDRTRAEEAERRAEALRAVAHLANAAAHEINNPLTVIGGRLELLARGLGRDDPMQLAIRDAMAASRRISEIVAHMRRITRLEVVQPSSGLPPILDLRRSGPAQ